MEHKTAWRWPKVRHSRSFTPERKVWRCTGGCFLGFMVGWRTSVQLRSHTIERQRSEEV